MRYQGFARVLALVALMFAALAPIATHAQSATSYTSQLSGQEVQTTGSWTIDTESSYVDAEGELVTLLGQFDGMIVAWLPPGTDLVGARDVFLTEFSSVFDNFTEIDRGAYGNVSYSLDITSAEGIEFGVFSLFLGERESGYVEYYLYFGPAVYFESGMASAKSSVTIGGNPVFDGVEPAGLQEILNANAGISGGSTAEPETNVVEEQPGNETETSDPQPTEAPDPDDDGAAEYFTSIQAEIDYLQSTVDDFYANLSSIETNDAALDELNRIGSEWQAYPERAATIIAPDRLTPFDASYRDLVTNVETLGNNWFAVIEALHSGDDAAYRAAFDTMAMQYDLVAADVAGLQWALELQLGLEESTGGDQGTEETPAPTEAAPEPTKAAPEPTQETTTGGDAEGDAYIASIEAELDYLQGTLDEFIVAFVLLAGDDPESAASDINRIASEWIEYPDRAASIVAPPGYEDIDDSYQTLASNVLALGQAWYQYVDVLQAGGDTDLEFGMFQEIMDTVQTQIDSLNARAGDTASTGTTTAEPTETPPTEVAQSEPEEEDTTNQGDRIGNKVPGTGEREDEIVNETETGQAGQGTPELTSFEDLGLEEEGLYISPQHGTEVTWGEEWLFGSDLTDPIESDTVSGRDSLVLVNASGPVALFYVDIIPSEANEPEWFTEYWTTEEYLDDADAELLLFDTNRNGTSAVVTREQLDDGTPIIILREVICAGQDCSTFVVSMILSEETSFVDAYRLARGAVDADGERTVSVFSNREIRNAIEE